MFADNPLAVYPLGDMAARIDDVSGHGHDGAYSGLGSLVLGGPGPLNRGNAPDTAVQAGGVPVGMVAHASFLPSGNAARTVEAWFRSDAATAPAAHYTLVAWGAAGVGAPYGLDVSRNALIVDHFGGTETFASGVDPYDGRWHQAVVVYDGATSDSMYLDGRQLGAPQRVSSGTLTTSSPSTLLFGDWIDHVFNSALVGSEADVSIYAAALTGAQVAAHYAAAAASAVTGPSSLATSLLSPSEVFGSAGIVVGSALVAAGAVMFVTFPAQMFNLTFQENYAVISGWFRRPRAALRRLRRETPRTRASPGGTAGWLAFASVVLAGAVLGALLDPKFGASWSTVLSVVGIILSTLVGAVIGATVTGAYHARQGLPRERHLRALPLGLLVAAVCVLVSRVTGFQPGYLYGVVAAVAYEGALSSRQSGHLAALSASATLIVALGAWGLWIPLNGAATSTAAFPLVVLDDLAAALFVGGVVGTTIGLLPLRFLPGGTITSWNRPAWFGLFGVSMFILVDFVLRSPASSRGSHTPLLTTIVMFVLFAAASVGFREYFAQRWRRENHVPAPPWPQRLRQLVRPRPAPREAEPEVALAGAAQSVLVEEDDSATVRGRAAAP